MAQGHPTVAAMAAYRHLRLPFARPQTLQTLQILHKSAHLRREKVPQQAQHAPLPHAKATTRPQQWLKGTPRPQQWLLIGVQGCRLLGLKPSKRSKRFQKSAQLRREQVHRQAQHAPLPHAKATTRATAMAEGHPPAAAMASYRRSRLPFARPQTLQTLQKSAQLRREKVPQQAQHAPLLATPNAAGKSHKATAMAEGHPPAAAMAIRASYRHSRPQQWLKGTPRSQQWLLIGI